MAIDIFLRLGDISGDSLDSEHKNEIEVLAWSWGADSSQSLQVRSGRRAGTANFQDLSVTKWVDSSSTDLLKLLATGGTVADAELTMRTTGDSPVEFVVLSFRPVIVTSISTGASGGEDRPTENVTLNFAEFKYTYTEQEDDGGAGGSEDFTWSILNNAPTSF